MAIKSTEDLLGEKRALVEERAALRKLCMDEWATMSLQLARRRNDRLLAIEAALARVARTLSRRGLSLP